MAREPLWSRIDARVAPLAFILWREGMDVNVPILAPGEEPKAFPVPTLELVNIGDSYSARETILRTFQRYTVPPFTLMTCEQYRSDMFGRPTRNSITIRIQWDSAYSEEARRVIQRYDDHLAEKKRREQRQKEEEARLAREREESRQAMQTEGWQWITLRAPAITWDTVAATEVAPPRDEPAETVEPPVTEPAPRGGTATATVTTNRPRYFAYDDGYRDWYTYEQPLTHRVEPIDPRLLDDIRRAFAPATPTAEPEYRAAAPTPAVEERDEEPATPNVDPLQPTPDNGERL